jgi:hypothetical protein
MHARAKKNLGRRLSEWAPARPSSPRGKFPLAAPCYRSGAILAILASSACVSNGSPPPAPTQEAPTENRALQPVAPAPTGGQAGVRDDTSRWSSAAPSQAELRQQLKALPDSVLMGTDVRRFRVGDRIRFEFAGHLELGEVIEHPTSATADLQPRS